MATSSTWLRTRLLAHFSVIRVATDLVHSSRGAHSTRMGRQEARGLHLSITGIISVVEVLTPYISRSRDTCQGWGYVVTLTGFNRKLEEK